jgi:hypothetical protein
MNTRRCLRIAERIDTLMRTELGIAVDAQRMLGEALYARDVLLVCDARRDSDLAVLSQHFRVAANERDGAGTQPSTWGQDSSGFSASSNSEFASSSMPGALPATPSRFGSTPAAQAERSRSWFSPYRWTDSDKN